MKLSNLLSEEDVIKVLQEENGFPKLTDSGGFEMLRTEQNRRNLVGLPSPWSSKSLKMNVGPQARIYLRPIQRTLSIDPITHDESPSVFIPCDVCHVDYSIHDLKKHIVTCGVKDSGNINSNELNIPDNGNSVEFHINSNEVIQDIGHNAEFEMPIIIPGIMNEMDVLETLLPVDVIENPKTISEIVEVCIQYCKKHRISNPVEILRKIQEEMVVGRPLEVENIDTSIEGDTTFITVDRDNILQTATEEIQSIEENELRKTIEVQFYNELAADYGGPRKEFFRLVLIEIKEKYFDNGIRELLAPDYRTVGIILALSILQNGKMPVFLPDIFDEESTNSIAMKNLREGLNVLGIFDLFQGLPELKFLLHPPKTTITMKKITTILRPTFSEEGSNALLREKEIYSLFIKYLREVAAGRRGSLTLSSILVFVCSTDEEPLLGFKIQPTIVFCAANESFIPTASTCINTLTLPRASQTKDLQGKEELFKLYDYAFSNAYYGLQ